MLVPHRHLERVVVPADMGATTPCTLLPRGQSRVGVGVAGVDEDLERRVVRPRQHADDVHARALPARAAPCTPADRDGEDSDHLHGLPSPTLSCVDSQKLKPCVGICPSLRTYMSGSLSPPPSAVSWMYMLYG